jgi:AAA15 family ATPase/GTPase
MIKSFEINNFRGFHTTKGNGFGRVNLFGGKNNAGKTTLLEALLLMAEPSNQSIVRLLGFRNTSVEYIKAVPEKSWENFFYQQQKITPITFKFVDDLNKEYEAKLRCDEIIDNSINLTQQDTENGSLSDFNSIISDREGKKSVIHIEASYANKQINSSFIIATEKGITAKSTNFSIIKSHFIPSSAKLAGKALAQEFDKSALSENKSDILLKAFQLIDNSIKNVRTYSIGEGTLYLSREKELPMPISLFGDAMNKVADFILRIINNPNSIILIDEIENGIHHENHRNLWKMLFDLCNEYKVQLFTTSHSAEMIEAFKDVVKENNFDGNYFKVARHLVSKEIIIQKMSNDVLESNIENHQPYRK